MLLLDAWALSGLGATSRLIVAGDGPQRNEAEERARTLQGVSFEGMVSASRVAELRRETGVSICCSTCFEAHPAIAESFSHGRPVVSTDVGALAGLVDDEVGWSAPANAVDLASALRSATDPVGIELRGIAARQRYVRSYRSDVVAAQLISIYESVIS